MCIRDSLGIVLDTDKASALGAEALWIQKSKPAMTGFYLGITSESSDTQWFLSLIHIY